MIDFADSMEAAHAPAVARGADCKSCPLYGQQQGPVLSEIRSDSELLVIGPYPVKDEIKTREVFRGPVGRLTRQFVAQAQASTTTSFTNVIACAVPRNDLQLFEERCESEGRQSPVTCCAPRLATDIQEASAKVIVPLGGGPLKAVGDHFGVKVGGKKSKRGERRLGKLVEQRGHPFPIEGGPVVLASVFAGRGQNAWRPVVQDDLHRAVSIARHGVQWTAPTVLMDRPDAPLSVDEIVEFCFSTRGWPWVGCDIETNSLDQDCLIRCVGLGNDELTVVIPLHHIGGEPYWQGLDLRRVEGAIYFALDREEVVFHNGAFDTERLIRRGLRARPLVWRDTLIMHRDTREQDLPHKLAVVASRFSQGELWKGDVDHKAEENEQRDEDLHYYNALDVSEMSTAYRGLVEWVARDTPPGMVERDCRLQRIARDMSSLGHFCFEPTRTEAKEKLHNWLADLKLKLLEAVGSFTDKKGRSVEFNPNSPEHVRKFLFRDKGHRPTRNSKKREWEEGDTEGTGIEALIELQDMLASEGMDSQTNRFLTALVAQRSVEQLRKLYVDNLPVSPSTFVNFSEVHPSFNVAGTVSGRWSSSKPNFQNLPSRAKVNVKTFYTAPPGHVIVGADYDQLELRLAAAVTGDQLLLEEFAKGKDGDPHTLNAATFLAETGSEEEIVKIYTELMRIKKGGTKEEKKYLKNVRTTGKTAYFAILYGCQRKKLGSVLRTARDKAEQIRLFPDLTDTQAERLFDLCHLNHPSIKIWQIGVRQKTRARGFAAEHVHGRRRHFPGGFEENEPPNHEIQGSAGALQNDSIEQIDAAIPHRGWSEYSGLFSNVHDFLAVIVPRDRADEAKEIINGAMNSTFKGVAITASAIISIRLSDQDEQLEVPEW